MGEFRKDQLPETRAYLESQGLRAAGRGRWVSTACQLHGGGDSLRWNTATGGWVCMACGEHGGDVLSYHMRTHGLSFIEAARELGAWQEAGQEPLQRPPRCRLPIELPGNQEAPRTVLADYGRDLFRQCQPLTGSAGEAYLRARRCILPPADGHLRFHSSLKHPSGYVGPALVGLVTDAVTRRPMTLHRTWIQADGEKAPVQPPRLLLGGHTKQGGVVRLWPDDSVTYGLGIAEGIETCLSLAHSYRPVWACLDAGNLAGFPVLAGIETLLIGADNDPAGQRGAEGCAARWWAAGAEVLITNQPQNDLNDVLKEAA